MDCGMMITIIIYWFLKDADGRALPLVGLAFVLVFLIKENTSAGRSLPIGVWELQMRGIVSTLKDANGDTAKHPARISTSGSQLREALERTEIDKTASTENQSTSQKEVLPTENAVVQPAVGHGVGSGGEEKGPGQFSAETAVRRKRGRPRKCGISGSVCHLLEPPPKQPRGRPRGSGRIQFLSSVGGCGLETAGGSFTPHVLKIKAGQDIGTEISSLALFPRAAIVFTASGTLSSVVLARHGQTGGFVRYDGYFEILSLSGDFTFSEVDGTLHMDRRLSIVLAQPDGRVFGGAVTGCLIAANPIQIVVGTFKQSIRKKYRKSRFGGESSSLNVVNGDLGSALAAMDNNDSIIPTPAMSHPLPIKVEEDSVDSGNNQTESPTPLRVYRCENNLESSLPMSPENDIATHTFRSKDESDNCC